MDKFVGDEAVALFIPGFAGQDHAARAVATARDLLETGHGDGDPWIPVGVGIHTGLSYVGYIAEGDAVDFTAVGDSVNTAAPGVDREGGRDRDERRGRGRRRARHVGP